MQVTYIPRPISGVYRQYSFSVAAVYTESIIQIHCQQVVALIGGGCALPCIKLWGIFCGHFLNPR